RSQDHTYVPLPDAELQLLVMNSMVQHELASSEYAIRKKECAAALTKLNAISWRDVSQEHLQANRTRLSELEMRRARHVVSEIERTQKMVNALQAGDLEMIARLMHASHISLRDDFQVSCKELDLLVDIAQEISPVGGIFGSRMTGGGFGGCTVSLVQRENAEKIMGQISSRYQAQTRIQPDGFITPLTAGARMLPLSPVSS
ncbi:MAG: galactokinase, partial [Pirellulaceae bacterium]|nr:galactokinase [Pirellulaceae bacterium]